MLYFKVQIISNTTSETSFNLTSCGVYKNFLVLNKLTTIESLIISY